MLKWKSTPQDLPADGAIVWCRLNYWFGPPFLASWSVTQQSFISSVNSIIYPVWTVSRWKTQ